jgi:hypothetical protein
VPGFDLKVFAERGQAIFTKANTIDFYEYVENHMRTFATRLQTEIKNDTTISAYNDDVAVVAIGELTRHKIGGMLANTLFIIHSLSETIDREMGGSGREDVVMEATITAAVRSAKGFNNTTDQEVALIGDNTATQPSVLEMQEHIHTLLHNSGAMNLLVSGGVPYIWDLEWGEVDVDVDVDKVDEVLLAHRKVIGHKWILNWS